MQRNEKTAAAAASVAIRKFEERDIPSKVRWINDEANNRYLHYELPLEEEKTLVWFRGNQNREDRYDAVIEWAGEPVGVIGLLSIEDGQAEYYITLGEERAKGRGVARQASMLLLEYAFRERGLRRVYLYTEVENLSAQRLFERCGFRRTGLAPKSAVNRGRVVDRYSYELLRADFLQRRDVENISTPILFLEDGTNQVSIKREDLFPFSFGGNKARKAFYFFREIDAGDYDAVVTYGSSSSNHCRIVSNMAAARKLPCYIISPEEASKPTYNSRMMELFGAEITVVPVEQVHDTIEAKLRDLRKAGKNPYFIAGGGHGNLGTQAYVDCYQEIRDYERRTGMFFDYIFFASGTGTTQAGLVCGQLLAGDERQIVGISIARKNPRGRQVVLDSIEEYLAEKAGSQEKANLLYPEEQIQAATIFEDGYTGDGYGQDNENIKNTIRHMLTDHGIPMDSTYTAKAWAGMQSYLSEREITGKTVLFLHTGGTPLFFDDLSEETDVR